ncbi:MAG: hypothetical protein M1831_000038 [Alyxoria varia]|nr:MAG: hypothetical protein M1831_000038 [Alyxoria varia]
MADVNANGNILDIISETNRPNVFGNIFILIEYFLYGAITFVYRHTEGIYHRCPSPHRKAYLASARENGCCPCSNENINRAYLDQAQEMNDAETSIARLQLAVKILVLALTVLLVLLVRETFLHKRDNRLSREFVVKARESRSKMHERISALHRFVREMNGRMDELEKQGLMSDPRKDLIPNRVGIDTAAVDRKAG